MTFELGGSDRAAWDAANAVLAAGPPPPPRPPWWRRHARWLAVGLAVDLVVGGVVLHALRGHGSTPQRAVAKAVERLAHKDYAGLQHALCTPDRARFSAADLATAGREIHLVLSGVQGFQAGHVTVLPDAHLGFVPVPARRVDGRLTAVLGPGSEAHVTVVKEPTAWKVCFSAGGYGLQALSVDEPYTPDLSG